MITYEPFLITTLTMGVVSMIVFLTSVVIFTIPVFATRGTTQAIWAGVVGLLLTVELAVLVTLTVLVRNGTIWNS